MSAIIPSQTAITARQRVLNIPELVEHILASADIRTILNCQRVSHFFRNVTKTSPEIQQTMWLLPDPDLVPSSKDKVFVNPLLLQQCREAEWLQKRNTARANYPDDFLMRLVWPDGFLPELSDKTNRDYVPKSMEVRSELRNRTVVHENTELPKFEPPDKYDKMTGWRRLGRWKGSKELERLRNNTVEQEPNVRRPVELKIKDIEIVTNRVRFLQKLLEGDGSWKGMILFQPNPFKHKEATFGYWVYQKSNVEVLRCNGCKWTDAVTVADVLKTVLRVNRDLGKL